ncbi:unnamed protein product [Urochloa humidicola]
MPPPPLVGPHASATPAAAAVPQAPRRNSVCHVIPRARRSEQARAAGAASIKYGSYRVAPSGQLRLVVACTRSTADLAMLTPLGAGSLGSHLRQAEAAVAFVRCGLAAPAPPPHVALPAAGPPELHGKMELRGLSLEVDDDRRGPRAIEAKMIPLQEHFGPKMLQ